MLEDCQLICQLFVCALSAAQQPAATELREVPQEKAAGSS